MTNEPPKRAPLNAPGDFYVEAGCCLHCCVPHCEAPDLMNEWKQDSGGCYFRRQPRTAEEIEQAIQAIHISCIAALRYGGTDPAIIRQLRELERGDCCDHGLSSPLEGEAPSRSPWWRRRFGRTG